MDVINLISDDDEDDEDVHALREPVPRMPVHTEDAPKLERLKSAIEQMMILDVHNGRPDSDKQLAVIRLKWMHSMAPSSDEILLINSLFMCPIKSFPTFKDFNYNVDKESFARLQNKQWLNDEVVNMYLKLLDMRQVQLQAYGRRKTAVVITSYLYKLFCRSGFKSVKKWHTFKGKKEAYMMVNISNCHWVLVAASFENKTIGCYDGLRGDPNKNMEIVRKVIDYFSYSFIAEDITPISEWHVLKHNFPTTYVQKNGYDCGVIALAIVDHLLDGLTAEDVNMEEFRLRIAADIVRGHLAF